VLFGANGTSHVALQQAFSTPFGIGWEASGGSEGESSKNEVEI